MVVEKNLVYVCVCVFMCVYVAEVVAAEVALVHSVSFLISPIFLQH